MASKPSLGPSDAVLFRGGDTFNFTQTFAPKGSGSPTNPITISSYYDNLPIANATLNFNAGGATPSITGILIANAGGCVISNLNIAGVLSSVAGAFEIPGIYFRHDGGNLDYNFIQVLNCTISNFMNGGGIRLNGNGVGSMNPVYDQGRYLNITINGCTITGCLYGVDAGTVTTKAFYQECYNGFTLTNCTISNNPGKTDVTPSGHGLLLVGAKTVWIDSNTLQSNGTQGSGSGHGGSYALDLDTCTNVLIQNNKLRSQRQTSGDAVSLDGGAIRLNSGCNQIVVQKNFAYDCWGAALLVADDAGLTTRNIVVRYNIFSANGTNPASGIQNLYILLRYTGAPRWPDHQRLYFQ